MFHQSGVRYLALLIKDNAVPIDECFCQFASIDAVTEGLESIKISEDAFLEVAAYLLGEFLDASARQKLFQFMDMDRDRFLGIHDWRQALASAEYWMSEDGKKTFAAIRIQSAWRGHFERSALTSPASGLFTFESVFQPIENQKYWEDEDEEFFSNQIPATVIDDSLSAHDVLSALTALAHPKGFTPHSLFVHICKSSSFDPEKAFGLDQFVESFINFCGDELTDQLHQALLQAFKQLLDLNGDGMVSSTEFLWVMRQYFEAQHASTWIEVEPTLNVINVEKLTGTAIVDLEPEVRSQIASVTNHEASTSSASISAIESTTAVAQMHASRASVRTQAANPATIQHATVIAGPESIRSTSSVNDDAELSSSVNIAHAAAKMQLAEAERQAAKLKNSAEAAITKQLADAAATKLAAEKLFAEASELKKAYEAAAAKQMAEASAIQKQAAEVALAKRTAEMTAAAQAAQTATQQKYSDSAASKRAAQVFDVNQAALEHAPEENNFAVKSSKLATGKLVKSTAISISPVDDTSNLAAVSSGPEVYDPSPSKHPSFDTRTLVQHQDSVVANVTARHIKSVQNLPQIPRPASSGGDHIAPKSVRFASNRPSTSDGTSNSLNSNAKMPTYSIASQSHQSRQPNSQQQSIIKIQDDEAVPATRRNQERPSTSYIASASADHGPTVMPQKQSLPEKAAGPEITKRVLLIDAENACTWVRACAQKIESRYVDNIR